MGFALLKDLKMEGFIFADFMTILKIHSN